MSANSRHLKRSSMPTAWAIKRKNIAFITRPQPGSHKREYATSVILLLRDILEYARNAKEVRYIVNNREILVNGREVKSTKLPIGLFDVVEIPKLEQKFVVLFDMYGKIKVVPRKDSSLLLKITGKHHVKGGKLQLNTMNGYNVYVDEKTFKKISVGDSIVYDSAKKKVSSTIPLAEKTYVYIFDGKFRGQIGQIQEFVHYNGLSKDTADILIGEESQKTLKAYCYPIALKKEEVKAFQ